jgi:tetratricopeptide (TPR) repeat protein
MKFFVQYIFALSLTFFVCPHYTFAQVSDPLWSDSDSLEEDEKLDELKTADQLIGEADFLLDDQRLLDARTKLMRALKKEPKNYRAHMMLSGYYLVHVGHFRLSLRYVREAERLFLEKNGPPPYIDARALAEHGQILYLISQARLNLDDYQGALDSLDDFERLHYQAQWYPGTRAWILMKLGKIEDAIRIARAGVIGGAEPGRTLNMLGILLSMHGEREESLSIFREAIAWELSQGSNGQPATPLNNSGEVYKELFMDEKAESNWLRAMGMPDGCEHILPTLNVSLLYFDQMNLDGAKKAFDSFESCVAQYPLRNGEEHKALLAFGRGRILLLSGRAEASLEQFEQSNKDRQWFGKIGTSEQDLSAAILQSMSQAHYAIANRLRLTIVDSIWDSFFNVQEEYFHQMLGWWYERKARRLLIEELKELEDISIRNTDSLLEYPTLGTVLRGLSTVSLKTRIELEHKTDSRKVARNFYEGYLGENLLFHGNETQGLALIQNAITNARSHFDDLFKAHLQALLLTRLSPDSASYDQIIQELFTLNRVLLRDRGLALPVKISGSLGSNELTLLRQAGIIPSQNSQASVEITFTRHQDSILAEVKAPLASGGVMQLKGERFSDLVNRLNENLFSIDVSG